MKTLATEKKPTTGYNDRLQEHPSSFSAGKLESARLELSRPHVCIPSKYPMDENLMASGDRSYCTYTAVSEDPK